MDRRACSSRDPFQLHAERKLPPWIPEVRLLRLCSTAAFCSPMLALFVSRRSLLQLATPVSNTLVAPVAPLAISGNRTLATMSYSYKYPRPSVTVDAVIVAKPQDRRPAQLLLIRRKNSPSKGQWALPGGFVDENEPLDKAAARELEEETSVKPDDVLLTQVGAFGDPGRDPRGWCVSVAYAALVPSTDMGVKAADDAADAQWHSVAEVPQPLAFDHKLIIRTAFEHLLQRPEVASSGALKEQLQNGARMLEGPWEPPKE